ncbi:MAG: hypothetical protein ABR915_22540 [Thermoguttaceae bacterium]|jgi:hypothetical protein
MARGQRALSLGHHAQQGRSRRERGRNTLARSRRERGDGSDVPCWLLDTDYNDLCFHVSQAFFPRTGAWENLKRALRGEYDESVWAHLAGTTSAPFEPGENRKIAVKVIDDRGNELLVVKAI